MIDGGGHERGMRSGTLERAAASSASARRARSPPGRWPAEARAPARACASGCARASSASWTWCTLNGSDARAPAARQPERLVHLRGGRGADHGHQGRRGVLGLGVHLRAASSRATCCARSVWARRLAHTSIRFGLGRFNTEEEVDFVAELIVTARSSACARCPRSTRCTRRASTSQVHPVDGALSPAPRASRKPPWRTATKSSTTTRTRATSARSTRPTRRSAPGLVGAPACGDVMRLQIQRQRRAASSRTPSSRRSAAARRSRRRRW